MKCSPFVLTIAVVCLGLFSIAGCKGSKVVEKIVEVPGPPVPPIPVPDDEAGDDEPSKNRPIPDITPPETFFQSGPEGVIGTTGATFEFFSSEKDSQFICQLNNQDPFPCENPLSLNDLSEGNYELTVVASDPFGNMDPMPARRSWTVDVTAPTLTLTVVPEATGVFPNLSNQALAHFEFELVEAQSGIKEVTCQLDDANPIPCSGLDHHDVEVFGGNSETPAGVTHTLTVRATDQADHEAVPASFSWQVDSVPPLAIVTPENGATNIPRFSNIEVRFSESVQSSTVSQESLYLATPEGDVVSGVQFGCQVNVCDSAVLFRYRNLNLETEYVIHFDSTIQDFAGNALVDGSSHFTTASIWRGVRQFGTSGMDNMEDVAVDGQRNIYVAGFVTGDLFPEDDEVHVDGKDVFLAKYNESGEREWFHQFGASGDDIAHGIVYLDGYVYITGETAGRLDPSNEQAPYGGFSDYFIAKYDVQGNRIWLKQYGTIKGDIARAIAVDSSQSLYVVGNTGGNMDGPHAGGGDAFVAKYDPYDGHLLWVDQFGGFEIDVAWNVATSSFSETDADGFITTHNFVYGVGSSRNNDLDGDGPAPFGDEDIFVVKYGSEGERQWLKQIGTSEVEKAFGVAVESGGGAADRVYVTGYTSGYLGGEGGANRGGYDALLLVLNGSGDILGREQFGTENSDFARDVAIKQPKKVVMSGYTQGSLDGGASFGRADLFAREYYFEEGSDSPHLDWSRQYGGTSSEFSQGLAIDWDKNIFVGGLTYGQIGNFQNAGNQDAILVKLNSEGGVQ